MSKPLTPLHTLSDDRPTMPGTVYRSQYPLPKPLFARQPLKFVWATLAILSNLVQLPFWILLYIVPRFRPNPKWSLQNSIVNHIVARNLYHTGAVGAITPLSLNPGWEGARLEVIHPSKKNVYVDTCVDPRGVVKPVPVPGTWTPAKPARGAAADKPTILHFHGGAFVIGDVRDLYSGFLGRTLAKDVAPQVIAGGYRLASNADGYFPAQLQDAVSWWMHLLDMGISPRNIVLSGDSAGANLAYTLLRYMELHRDIFPDLPGAILLWSPWVDLVPGFHTEEVAKHPSYRTDYIVPSFPGWGATSMAINYDATDPWLSPLRGPFTTSVPIFIQCGSSEILYDDILLFYKKIDALKNKVEIHVSENCNHDIILIGRLMGFKKEVAAATAHAKKFLDAALANKA